jgi:flagellar biosynthetic protein FlhB
VSEEKTEKPTPKRRKENRKQGQVARTPEIGAWSALVLVASFLPTLLGRELTELQEVMARCFSAGGHASTSLAMRLLGDGLWHAMIAVLVLGSGVAIVGVVGAISQGGFYVATKAVKPSFSKLNPLTGLKRILGPHALWEGLKMLLRSAVVAGLVYAAVRSLVPMIGGLVPVPVVLSAFGHDATGLLRNVALVGLGLAVADYAVQRRKIGKKTRMSKEEVKQEHKQSEGDPLLKGAIRSRQLAAARNRMMQDVPLADVVLVNPTHVAIALRYDPERGAPRVVARGAGVIAAAIRERAEEARVTIVRDVPLARALYTSTQIGHEIPPELFAAVAQVLAFVINRRSSGQRGGAHRSPRDESELPAVPTAGRRRRVAPVPSAVPSTVPSTALAAGR